MGVCVFVCVCVWNLYDQNAFKSSLQTDWRVMVLH